MQQPLTNDLPKRKTKRELIQSIDEGLGLNQKKPKISKYAQSTIDENRKRIRQEYDRDSFIYNFVEGLEQDAKGLVGNAAFGWGQLTDWVGDKTVSKIN